MLAAASSFFSDAKNCISSLKLLSQHIAKATTIEPSVTTCRRILHELRLSRKRLSSKVLGRVNGVKIQEFRERYDAVVRTDTLVVSVDECSFSEKVQPLYGYSHVGERCVLRSLKGGWTTRSLVLGIASDGSSYNKVITGSLNRELFGEFVLDMPYPPGTILLLDNCKIHEKLYDVYEAKGYTALFLSPYSPRFQPVELAFSKIKGLFRREWPWVGGVEASIQHTVDLCTPSDISGFFKHATDELVCATRQSGLVDGHSVP
jgi:transposase